MNLSGLPKLKEQGWLELAKALRDNTSLLKLDLSKNSFTAPSINELLLAIQDNYAICELILDVKGSSMPHNYATNQLLSMYQVFISREAVYL